MPMMFTGWVTLSSPATVGYCSIRSSTACLE